ncbi:NAD(P)-binding protein [Streptomyces sp. NPDC044780]|uniref:NAD(P)-binding protein n=1 Tax=unclassified Streptomyces TaxID=2593676 RepID=UPI0033EF6551
MLEQASPQGTVVVGGGMAGLAVARAMCEEGAEPPLVLEAGPDIGTRHYRSRYDGVRADEMWLHPVTDPHFWRPYVSANDNWTDIAGLRRCVGGRSLYWHGVVLPLEEAVLNDTAAWPREIAEDLTRSWRGGPSLYDRERRRLEEWTGRSLTLEPTEHTDLGLDGLAFSSLPKAVRPDGDDGRWEAYSPLHDGAPDVVADAEVLGVLVTDGRVRGVRLRRPDGAVEDVRADRVVLCASTFENSRLALQALYDTGARDVPVLTGLVDKVAQGVVVPVAVDRLPDPWRRLASSGENLLAPCPPGPGGAVGNLFLHTSTTPDGLALLEFYVLGEQHRGEHGRLICDPAGPWPWPVVVDGRHDAVDDAIIEAQRQLLTTVWETVRGRLGLDPATLHFTDPLGAEPLATTFKRTAGITSPRPPHTYAFRLGSELHEAGTLPYGPMLTTDGELRGVRGLYVSGPATFPRTGAANPVLTILALARRLGAHLAK